MAGSEGLSWKKAIARISAPIQIRIKPIATIARKAPINISNPAVPNKPTVDFAVTSLSERLTKKVAMIANIHTMTKTAASPKSSGMSVVGSKLVRAFVSGVML